MSESAGVPDSASRSSSGDQTVSRRTWLWVHGVILFAACCYTVAGLRFDFLGASGRPGAGFFPRILGVSLIVAVVYILAANWKRIGPGREGLHHSAVLFFGLAGALFIASLAVLGTWLGIALFLFATLTALNPGRYRVNIPLSIAVPVGFYLLFDVWLGVALPQGLILPSP